MHKTTAQVLEFHEAFGLANPPHPRLPEVNHRLREFIAELGNLGRELHKVAAAEGGDTMLLRLQLITEELSEFADAVYRRDLTNALHELCDLEYVVQGTVISLGLETVFEPAFDKIHRANMSKLDENGKPVLNEAGRVVKSDRFRPADVSPLIPK